MGYQKFKLSDMIPNVWFHKLRYMNQTNKKTQFVPSSMLNNKHHHIPPPPPPPSPPPLSAVKTPRPVMEPQCQSRKSYHITRELTIDLLNKTPPRKSKSSSKSRRSTRRSSSTSSCSCQSTFTSQSSGSKSRSWSPPSPLPIEETDVVLKDVDNVGFLVEDALLRIRAQYAKKKQSILDNNAPASDDKNDNKSEHFTPRLAPIITKQKTKTKNDTQLEKLKHDYLFKEVRANSPPSRKLTINSSRGVRLKVNSPRIIGRKQGQNGNKNVGSSSSRKSTSNSSKKIRKSIISESFAVVKSSFDPQNDFKESMVEMIVQNNLRAPKDLENLLACYLSLNSVEYHQVIIKVFKQIWFDLRHQ
ncbi:hypothetical protein vseg_010862 [Gypsophila vaccaria]